LGEQTLVATVENDGRWKPARKSDERGRGSPLMRALMDGVERHQANTIARLALKLEPCAELESSAS